ncbi:MAG: ABC transporter ATP-binding protein/permease, partial [Pseudomonadota bacterium]
MRGRDRPTDDPSIDISKAVRHVRSLLGYLWGLKARIGFALSCLLLAKLATVSVPWTLKGIVDGLEAQGPLLVPLALVAAYGALRLASSGFNELRDVLFARARYTAMHRLSVDLLAHLHRQGHRFHLERNTGAVSRDLERGTASLSELLNYLVFSIVPTLAELLLVLGIMYVQFSPKYAATTLVAVGLYAFFTLRFMDWRARYRLEQNRLDSEANGRAIDSLLNHETVKSFGNESRERDAYDQLLSEWSTAAQKSQLSMSALNFGQAAIVGLGVTAILLLAVRDVAAGAYSLGDLVMLNALLLQLFIPLNVLGVIYRSMRYALINMERLVNLLDHVPDVVDAPDAVPLRDGPGRVVFDRVRFRYDDRPILDEVSFAVEPGHKVAIVGPSGAGKSTLARLLFRFFDPTDGQITIDDQPLAGATLESVRARLALVPQDTVLFNDTLGANLEYAQPGASEAVLLDALEAADLGDFVRGLPSGLETLVGERGLKLSGGEKQRVAIARALLRAAPIVVFDEATSSLDSQSEQQILTALRRLQARCTSLVIAHRLSTVVDADRIVVLDAGRVVEQGTHAALLDQHG